MISVVVAAYNEEGIIKNSVRRVLDFLRENIREEWELVVVNDGSSDKTGEILDQMAAAEEGLTALHHHHNYGQGKALRTAFGALRGDVVVTLDADLSYGPEYVKILTGVLREKGVDIALASPYAKEGTIKNVPYYRLFLSKWGNFYLAKMSHYKISTSTCVVRAYRRDVLDSIFLTSDGMELQLEILMKAAMMGYKVSEVPANLAWDIEKLIEADFGRVSKMKILRTIALYLKMGWLFRPAYLFIIGSLLLMLPGLYMAAFLFLRVAGKVIANLSAGPVNAVTIALSETFAAYTYSFMISAALVTFGFQLFIFSMLIIQNKFYFEELYRLGQQILFFYRREKKSPGPGGS